jgi:hypothetical protein
MKQIIYFLFLLFSSCQLAAQMHVYNPSDTSWRMRHSWSAPQTNARIAYCGGVPQAQPPTSTAWMLFDTVGTYRYSSSPVWIVNPKKKWLATFFSDTTKQCPTAGWYYQFRIDSTTGIQQYDTVKINYTYNGVQLPLYNAVYSRLSAGLP